MSKYHVERSTQIQASPEEVFNVVADYGTWTSWSPWLCAEPDAAVVVSDKPDAVGSTYAWNGTVVGAGELEHLRLEPGSLIEDEIRFLKPFRSVSRVAFNLKPVDGGTEICWQMDGQLPWFLFWMQSQIEIFIGMDYERGLRMLKERIETGTVRSETKIRGIESVGPLRILGTRGSCTMKEVSQAMEAAFKNTKQALEKHELPTDGKMLSVYHDFDMKAQRFDFTSGYVVPESAGGDTAGLSSWSIPLVQALSVEHIGSYEHLGNAWSAANQVARYRKLKQSKVGAFEIYTIAGEDIPPAEWKTEIYLPLK